MADYGKAALSQVVDGITKRKKYGNVLDYGADPTGVIDSTNAIQQCVNENSVVEFPAGIFITKSITLNSRNHVIGQGDMTIIKANKDTVGQIFKLASYCVIKKLRIDGNISNTTNTINAIADNNQTDPYFRVRVSDVTIMNLNGNGIYFPGRGMDYIIDKVMVSCNGYGLYMGTVSDSAIINSSFAAGKSGISINYSNYRIVGSKIYCCGNGDNGVTPYAGIEVNNAGYVMISGCEIQENYFDAVLFKNSYGNVISGTVFDSNNKAGITGAYGQIKLVNSKFNRINAVFVDGRFTTHNPAIACMYGVIVDNNSCYNNFDITYSPDTINTKLPRLTPYSVPLTDISSVFKWNNRDYFDFNNQAVLIGTNATIDTWKSDTINVTATGTIQGLDFLANATTTLTTSNSYFQRITLDNTKLGLTGKSNIYVSYQSKVKDELNLNITLSEESTTHTTVSSSGSVNINGVTRNTQYIDGAAYKPLNYSNEAGYKLHIEFSIGVGTSTPVSQNDILASLKNVRISVS